MVFLYTVNLYLTEQVNQNFIWNVDPDIALIKMIYNKLHYVVEYYAFNLSVDTSFRNGSNWGTIGIADCDKAEVLSLGLSDVTKFFTGVSRVGLK